MRCDVRGSAGVHLRTDGVTFGGPPPQVVRALMKILGLTDEGKYIQYVKVLGAGSP